MRLFLAVLSTSLAVSPMAHAAPVKALQPLLLPSEDDLRIHPLCALCEAKAILLGRANAGGQERFWVV